MKLEVPVLGHMGQPCGRLQSCFWDCNCSSMGQSCIMRRTTLLDLFTVQQTKMGLRDVLLNEIDIECQQKMNRLSCKNYGKGGSDTK